MLPLHHTPTFGHTNAGGRNRTYLRHTATTGLQSAANPLGHFGRPLRRLQGIRTIFKCDKQKERAPHALRWSGPLDRKSLSLLQFWNFWGAGGRSRVFNRAD